MQAYSQDLRDRVLRALDRGERPTDIATRLEVSRVWVYQVRARLEREGHRTSLPMGGYRKSRIRELASRLSSWRNREKSGTGSQLERVCGPSRPAIAWKIVAYDLSLS